MAMVFCRGCGKEIHETASTCPQCGAPQGNLTPSGSTPYSSYDEVPVYRKNWFAILCSFIFFPAVIGLLLTGDIYYESKGQLRAYSKGAKIFFYGLGLIMIASIIWSADGSKLDGTYSDNMTGVAEQKMRFTFMPNGTVRMAIGGGKISLEFPYEVRGNKIKVTGQNGEIILIILDDGDLLMNGIRLKKENPL